MLFAVFILCVIMAPIAMAFFAIGAGVLYTVLAIFYIIVSTIAAAVSSLFSPRSSPVKNPQPKH